LDRWPAFASVAWNGLFPEHRDPKWTSLWIGMTRSLLKIVSKCREPSGRVYYGAAYEIKKEIPTQP
jgi:hypothetical protein